MTYPRRPLAGRELIVHTPGATSVTTANTPCPKCGTFGKSGRVSCCAPGGAWFKNCGGASNRNVGHRWFEGVEACKLVTTTTTRSVCPKCGTIGKSGKMSCCGRGGSWFRNCGSAGNSNLEHTWFEGIRACKTRSRSNTVIGQQLNAAQQINSSPGAGMVDSNATIATAK